MLLATIDKNGDPTGFYSSMIHGKDIPAGAVEISEADWQAHLSGDLRRYKGGKWQPYVPPVDVAAVRAGALAGIDAEAEAARLRYITGGAGQAAVYVMKAKQAADYIASGYVDPAPALVVAEAAALGLTNRAAADSIAAQADAWLTVAAQIEQIRRKAKADIEAAATAADIEAAAQAAQAALAGV